MEGNEHLFLMYVKVKARYVCTCTHRLIKITYVSNFHVNCKIVNQIHNSNCSWREKEKWDTGGKIPVLNITNNTNISLFTKCVMYNIT